MDTLVLSEGETSDSRSDSRVDVRERKIPGKPTSGDEESKDDDDFSRDNLCQESRSSGIVLKAC